MKAPTADYSPISQALSAKSSAIQSGYAAKDASNWKSRYEIQQKSFDIQQEAIDDAKAQNHINLVTNLTSAGLTFANTMYKINASNDSQLLSSNGEQLSVDMKGLANKYKESGTPIMTLDEETGGYVFDADFDQSLREMIDNAYDPSQFKTLDEKYLTAMKETAYKSVRESYAEQFIQDAENEADALFSMNYGKIMADAVQNGSQIVSLSLPDGSGSNVEVSIPSTINASIDSMTHWSDAKKNRVKLQAAEDYQSQTGDYLVNNLGQLISSGDFMADTTSVTTLLDSIKKHEDSIRLPEDRQTFHDDVENALSSSIGGFINNQISTIADNGNDFNDVQKFLDEFNPGGQLYGLFYDEEGNRNEYITEGLYSTSKSAISAVKDNLETQYGTAQTAQIQQAFQNLIASNPTPNAFTMRVDEIMQPVYGDKWRQNPEAVAVVLENIKEMLPKDQKWANDEGFKKQLQKTWDVIFDTTAFTLNDADSEHYSAAVAVQNEMQTRLLDAIITNPGVMKDPVKLQETMADIASAFTTKFWDALSTNVNEDNAPEVSRQWLLDNLGESYTIDPKNLVLSEDGILQSDTLFVSGMYDRYHDSLKNIGSSINLTAGIDVDIDGGMVQFDKETLKPKYAYYKSNNGQNEYVKYNLETGSIEFTNIIGKDSGNDGANVSDETTATGSTDNTGGTIQTETDTDGIADEILGKPHLTPIERLKQCPDAETLTKVYNELYPKLPIGKKALKKEYMNMLEQFLSPEDKAVATKENLKATVEDFSAEDLATQNLGLNVDNLSDEDKKYLFNALEMKTIRLWENGEILTDLGSLSEVFEFMKKRDGKYMEGITSTPNVSNGLDTESIRQEKFRKQIPVDLTTEGARQEKFNTPGAKMSTGYSSTTNPAVEMDESKGIAVKAPETLETYESKSKSQMESETEYKTQGQIDAVVNSLRGSFPGIDNVISIKNPDTLMKWWEGREGSKWYERLSDEEKNNLEIIYKYQLSKIQK